MRDNDVLAILDKLNALQRRVEKLEALESGENSYLTLTDGITAPAAVAGQAFLYVNTGNGDLEIVFGDSHTTTVAADS